MLGWQLFLNGLLAAGIYALVAVGFGLIYRTTHFFNFAHGAVYTLGAYLICVLNQRFGISTPFSILIATVIAAAVGVALWLFVYSPLRQAGASDLILLVASVGIFTVFQNSISAVFGDASISLGFGAYWGVVEILGARVTSLQILIAATAFFLCLAVTVLLWRTRLGNAILAVGADTHLAELSGIDSNRVTVQVFALGSAMAALGGILIGMDTDITPLMGYGAMLNAIVAIIVGGARNPIGWLVGAVVLGIAQHVGVWRIESHWQDAIAFGLLLLFMIFRPNGLIPSPEIRE